MWRHGKLPVTSTLLVLLLLAASRLTLADPTVIYLVRHAERADGTAESSLSPAGRQRARRLADILAGQGITHIHSTAFARTMETAALLAERLSLAVEPYDPAGLELIADSLLVQGGIHVVVGHSNTTIRLLEILIGATDREILEEEYDRLYRLQTGSDATISRILTWY
jgi:broad specificity phosphatase PhoE